MKQFFVFYMAKSEDFKKIMEDMAKMSESDRKKSTEAWESWMEENKDALVDGGKPLGKTKKVTRSAVTDTKNEIGGYSIVQADSFEEAAKIVQGNPHLSMMPSAWIEIMEVMPMDM